MNLTEHFTLEELAHSDTAVRLGIDNTPPPAVLPHLVVASQGMERVRSVLGHPVTVHSGYRAPELEHVLCEADYTAWCDKHDLPLAGSWAAYLARKAHPKGYAVDFICPAFGTPTEIVHVLKASGVKFDQLIEEGTWVHASFDPQLRGEVLTAKFDSHGTPTYTKEA